MNLYEQWLQKADDIGLNVVESVPFESQAKGHKNRSLFFKNWMQKFK